MHDDDVVVLLLEGLGIEADCRPLGWLAEGDDQFQSHLTLVYETYYRHIEKEWK